MTPDITGASSGSSARVVKLIRPCLTWIVCLLPLFLLFWLELWPWFVGLARGHSRAKWVELPQLMQRFALLGRRGGKAFGLGPFCWGAGGCEAPCCYGGLNTQHPGWGALRRALEGAFCTMRYLCSGALEGPASAFLFLSARWAVMQSSCVIAKLTCSL